jgi:hypothetical protein
LKKGAGLFMKEDLGSHTSPLTAQSHLEAEKAAVDFEIWVQIVLWGTSFEYGSGVVVQSYLSIPEYEDYREAHHEDREVRIPGPQEEILISTKNSGMGIPQQACLKQLEIL